MSPFLSGIAMTLLVLLPLTIRDEFYMRAIKRQKKEAEDELARMRAMVVPSVGTI